MSLPKNLTDILIAEIKDLYSAETQLIKALPKMAKAASDAGLKDGFIHHLAQTRQHAARLEKAAKLLHASSKGKVCQAMKGLITEGADRINLPAGSARDASLIGAAQKVEHYEMAGYGTVRTFAQVLGRDDVAEILQTTLDEESNTNDKLTSLASRINPQANVA